MKKNMTAIRKAESEMRNMNAKAQEYYRSTSDGSWVESYDGKVVVKYGTGESKEYPSIGELAKVFAEMYDNMTAETVAEEIDGINHKQAEMIVKLYDEIYGDELVDIVKDYENGYLTINTGRDGNEYAWYGDELKNKAVNLATGEVIDGDKIDEMLV